LHTTGSGARDPLAGAPNSFVSEWGRTTAFSPKCLTIWNARLFSKRWAVTATPHAAAPVSDSSLSRKLLALIAALGVIVVACAASGVLSTSSSADPGSTTVVEWHHYRLDAGSAPDLWNATSIPGQTYCAPYGATTIGQFSMLWSTSSGFPLGEISLRAEFPPAPDYPDGYAVSLYLSANQSSGGTSFLSFDPEPCAYNWTLSAEASSPLTVNVVSSLTFNYTAPGSSVT
jgi:hypothetical protein